MSTSDLIGRVYKLGEVIFSQGDLGDEMYLVQSGAVEYSYRQGDSEAVLTVLEQGDFFGEMAVVDIDPRSATARAFRNTQVVIVTKEALVRIFDRHPELMTLVTLNIARVLSQRLRSIDEDLAALSG